MSETYCQIRSVHLIGEGLVKLSISVKQRLKILLSTTVTPKTKRKIKNFISNMYQLFNSRKEKEERHPVETKKMPVYQAGDWVRIRSAEEIQLMLDNWGQFRGCAFMPAMQDYCGTVQRVLKPVERFIDERDYQVKRCSNLYVLEGVMCQGTDTYGRCDRCCLYFWRGEWLEKQEELLYDQSLDIDHRISIPINSSVLQ